MNHVTPETYSNGREDTHYIFLSTDWPELTADDGRTFDAESVTITFSEEAPIPGDELPDCSCQVTVTPDTWSENAKEWEGKAPECRYFGSSRAKGTTAPQWVVDVVIRHRPEWYPKNSSYIPRPERPLKAV